MYSPVLLVISYFSLCVLSRFTPFHFILVLLPFYAILSQCQRYWMSPTYQALMSMYTVARIHGNKEGLGEQGRGTDDKGNRQNRREMLDTLRWLWTVKPLQLPPPPLAVFFLIASWAIFGGHLKWELWGEGTEGVEEECFCAYACVIVYVGKGGHLVLLRQWTSTLIGSRVGDVCVRACVCGALLLLETREETHMHTKSHKHMHKHTHKPKCGTTKAD